MLAAGPSAHLHLMTENRPPLPAIHLCTVPTRALPDLVTDHPVVDTDRYEGRHRVVGKLLEAHLSADGLLVTGKVELRVYGTREPAWRGGGRSVRLIPVGFALPANGRVTAHLPSPVLARTPGAVDVEHG